jgi:hypothetical protein
LKASAERGASDKDRLQVASARFVVPGFAVIVSTVDHPVMMQKTVASS